jgi:hypothetical protein
VASAYGNYHKEEEKNGEIDATVNIRISLQKLHPAKEFDMSFLDSLIENKAKLRSLLNHRVIDDAN